jgi:hypothetical protein
MFYNNRKLEGVSHAKCGGIITLNAPKGVRELCCEKCNWIYECESLERPIHAVYRLIDEGTFIDTDYEDENVI